MRNLPQVFRRTYAIFTARDPIRMAAATAFFTTFALPPILFIIVQFVRLLFPEHPGRRIFSSLADTVGPESSRQVANTLKAFRNLGGAWYVSLAVTVLLAFVATNLFKIIRDSINELWDVKGKEGAFMQRLKSVSFILITSFLFVIALLAEGAQTYFGALLKAQVPWLVGALGGVVNGLISVIIVAAWFALLFRTLPDGRPAWRVAITGGSFTSLLFHAGKLVLRVLLIQSNVSSLFGASAAFVLLLLFVFYCSLILYFGAAFTKAWGDMRSG